MDLFHIIALGLGLVVGFPCGIWWTYHNLKNHPEKVERIRQDVLAARDRVRAQADELRSKS